MSKKIAFSCLYNEPEVFLNHLISNFLGYTDENCILIINFSNAQHCKNIEKYDHKRIIFQSGIAKREKWGETLLSGHVENFDLLIDLKIYFEYFVTIASNSLFFRFFDKDKTIKKLEEQLLIEDKGVCLDDLPEYWHWPLLRNQEYCLKKLDNDWGIKHLYGGQIGQIEGLFASKADWELIAKVHKSLVGNWNDLQAPLEEILPFTVIHTIGSGKSLKIAKVNWGRSDIMGGMLVNFSDIINCEIDDIICLWKWFSRDIRTNETLMVCHPVGQEVLKFLQDKNSDADAAINLKSALDSAFFFSGKKTKHVNINKILFKEHVSLVEYDGCAERNKLPIESLSEIIDKPFVFFENFCGNVKVNISVTDEFRLKVMCRTIQDNVGSLVAYFYLPLLYKYISRLVIVERPLFQVKGSVQPFVIYNGERFTKISCSITENIFGDVVHEYCVDKSPLDTWWLGIPIKSNSYIVYDIILSLKNLNDEMMLDTTDTNKLNIN